MHQGETSPWSQMIGWQLSQASAVCLWKDKDPTMEQNDKDREAHIRRMQREARAERDKTNRRTGIDRQVVWQRGTLASGYQPNRDWRGQRARLIGVGGPRVRQKTRRSLQLSRGGARCSLSFTTSVGGSGGTASLL